MLPAFTTVTAPAVPYNPVIPADRAAALVGDAAAGREEENAPEGPRDAAGIHHGHGGVLAVNPVMPADRAAALVGDAAARVEVNAIAVDPAMLPAFTTVTAAPWP